MLCVSMLVKPFDILEIVLNTANIFDRPFEESIKEYFTRLKTECSSFSMSFLLVF